MTDTKSILVLFAELLSSSWLPVTKAEQDFNIAECFADFAQANWELLVEGALVGQVAALQVYGDGADSNGASSRILFPNRLPSHRLILASDVTSFWDAMSQKDVKTANRKFEFDRLGSFTETGWFTEKPPFDFVNLTSNSDGEFAIALADFEPALEPVKATKH